MIRDHKPKINGESENCTVKQVLTDLHIKFIYTAGRLLLLYRMADCCCCTVWQTAAAVPYGRLLLLYPMADCCCCTIWQTAAAVPYGRLLLKKLSFTEPRGSLLCSYTLFWASWIQQTFSYTIYLCSILILLPHQQLRLQMSPFRFLYNWIIELFIMQFSSCSSHFLNLRYKYFLQHLILKHFQSMFLPLKEQVSHSCITTGKIIILYAVINTLLDHRQAVHARDKFCVSYCALIFALWLLTFRRRDLNPPCSATVPRFLERSFNF